MWGSCQRISQAHAGCRLMSTRALLQDHILQSNVLEQFMEDRLDWEEIQNWPLGLIKSSTFWAQAYMLHNQLKF